MIEPAHALLATVIRFQEPGLVTELALLVVVEMVLGTVILVGAFGFALVTFVVVLVTAVLTRCGRRTWSRRR